MVVVVVIPLLLGLGFGAGVASVVAGVLGRPFLSVRAGARPSISPRLGLAAALGLAAYAATGWPVALFAGAGLGALVPSLFGGSASHRAQVAKALAVAGWTEMLRDTRAVGVGLGQAIATTALVAPAAIAPQVETLAARCRQGPMSTALAAFAAEVDDRTADLVVAALIANEQRSGSLDSVLSALAGLARDEAAQRQRLDATRQSVETSVRIVSGVTIGLLLGLLVLNRGFLKPYDSALGQAVLALILGCFAASFLWLARLRRVEVPERFLTRVGGRRTVDR
ncbi:MAG: type II secretion system F family protein [Acidimicrobiales bacterium]